MSRRMHVVPILVLVMACATARAADSVQDCPATASPTTDAPAAVRALEHGLGDAVVPASSPGATIADRMRFYGVPGISVAIVHDGRVAWSGAWGVRDVATCAPATTDTVFQAASISKSLAALATLRLAERGTLDLDADVNAALKGWKLPDDPALPGAVSIRQLLSHTAGLGVHGFPGYAQTGALPTVVQILDGKPPANSPAIRREKSPGAQFQYSGGGYTVLQLLLADATGETYDALLQREVFDPLGMHHSSVGPVLPDALRANHAEAHDGGRVMPGGWHRYPELAAAAVWTTPGDLALFLVDVQAAAAGVDGHALTPDMARRMTTAQVQTGPGTAWGLGLSLDGEGDALRFGHDGGNAGFEATMVGYVHRGEGIVVMTNATRGRALAAEIVRAAADAYGWTELASRRVEPVALTAVQRTAYAGYYSAGPMQVWIEPTGDGLQARIGGTASEPLLALTPTRVVATMTGTVGEFERDAGGAVTGLRIVEGGPPVTLVRGTPPGSPLAAAPVLLRGSMNDWGTETALSDAGDGVFAVDLKLARGRHEFKLASADWAKIDLGVAGGSPALVDTAASVPLVTRGANIVFQASRGGRYRVAVRATPGGALLLDVTRLGD